MELFLYEKKLSLFYKISYKHASSDHLYRVVLKMRQPDCNPLGIPKYSLIPKDTLIHFPVWAAGVTGKEGVKENTSNMP